MLYSGLRELCARAIRQVHGQSTDAVLAYSARGLRFPVYGCEELDVLPSVAGIVGARGGDEDVAVLKVKRYTVTTSNNYKGTPGGIAVC